MERFYNISVDNNVIIILRKYFNNDISYLLNADINTKQEYVEKLGVATLDYYEKNIMHGGIRISNIFIENDNVILSDPFQNLLRNNTSLDILDLYTLSPKIIKNLEDPDADVWAYFCLSYYIMTNKHIFISKNIIDLINEMKRYNGVDELYNNITSSESYTCLSNENERNIIAKNMENILYKFIKSLDASKLPEKENKLIPNEEDVEYDNKKYIYIIFLEVLYIVY